MSSLDIFKSALSYAVHATVSQFFRWIGYFLGSFLMIILSGFVTLLPVAFFMKDGLGSSSLVIAAQFLLMLVAISVFTYSAISAAAVVPRNMLNYYDKKSFSGFTPFFMPASFVALVLISTVIIGLITAPGVLYFMVQTGNVGILQFAVYSTLFKSFIEHPFAWTSILVWLPGMYISSRLCLAVYIAVDTACDAVDALKKSWEITGRYQALFFGNLFLFTVLGLIHYVGALSSIIFMITQVYLYRTLSKK